MLLNVTVPFKERKERVYGTPCFIAYTPYGVSAIYWAKRLNNEQMEYVLWHSPACQSIMVVEGKKFLISQSRIGKNYVICVQNTENAVITSSILCCLCNTIQLNMRKLELAQLISKYDNMYYDAAKGLKTLEPEY